MTTLPAAHKPEEGVASQEIVIEAGKSELHYWRDLWHYRELFYFLAWRDILVRYKQTVIGIAWAVIQPLSMTLVAVFIFQYIAKLPSLPNVPYVIMVLVAQLPWQFFSRALTDASISLVKNTELISKIYFPRLIIPASAVITALIDLAISAALLAVMMVFYRYTPDWRILALPLFLLLAIGLAVGIGLWFAALTVSYRDFRFIVPFAINIGYAVSPVNFPTAVIPEKFRLLYSLNPMVGVIDGFRWSLLRGSADLNLPAIATSIVLTTVAVVTGVIYFRKTERRFADVI